MRDCFIEALDPYLALKLREKEVADLDQALSTALKLEAIDAAAAASREKQSEPHRGEKGRDKYARNVVVARSRNDNIDMSLLSKLDKRLDQMQSEFKVLQDFVVSNKQQQNPVPHVQIVNPPAASASQQKANDDARMNSHPVSAHSEVRLQPPFSHNRFSSVPVQKRRGCFICQDTGHYARSCPLNNRNNQPFSHGSPHNPAAGNRATSRSRKPLRLAYDSLRLSAVVSTAAA